MTTDHVELINIGSAYLIEAFVDSVTPFHLVMETGNWEPPLPLELMDMGSVLFSFVDDTLRECINTPGGLYLFVSINGNEYTYEVNDQSIIHAIFADSEEFPGKPGKIIFNRPKVQLEESYDDEEEGKRHSMDMFLSNPDNEKFFKT
jgi:hypothetical protein